MPYRVIQWATGTCGKVAIRAIASHPELQLVGARVYDPAKAGRDVGDLAGIGPVGVKGALNDAALFALDADCILWMGAATMFAPGASLEEGIDDLCKMLESGKNVITIVHAPFVHPGTLPASMRDPIEAACRKGKTSFHASGIDPGFASEVMSLTASGLCQRIDTLSVQEILDYAAYNNPQIVFDVMGFGKPPNPAVQQGFVNAMMFAYGSSMHLIAEGLGTKLDKIVPYIEVRPAEKDLTIAAGTVKKGMVSAMRFGFDGYVGGKVRLKIEHVTRLDKAQAPDWEHGAGYVIKIRGVPSMDVTFKLGVGADHELRDSVTAAAMHAVNAIPAVCKAAPGIRSFLDLPMITGRHTLARAS